MSQKIDNAELEREIAALEKEVGWAMFPVTRDSCKDIGTYHASLSMVKQLKDSDSPAWTKMRNWD